MNQKSIRKTSYINPLDKKMERKPEQIENKVIKICFTLTRFDNNLVPKKMWTIATISNR